MPKFCANLTMLWNELGFLDRFAAAAKWGFKGVEYLFRFEHVDRIRYQGWIGCEYKPLTTTDAGLGWIQAYIKGRK